MQSEFLDLLNFDVRNFVEGLENESGIKIDVVLDVTKNKAGPLGLGKLAVQIDAQRACIFAPTDGYFPDGGVRHEALHIHRLHVEGVPRISLADSVESNNRFEKGLVQVDNAFEHLIIVPIELDKHPERREHWEAVMARIWCADLRNVADDLDRRIYAYLNWAFLRHVLPISSLLNEAQSFMKKHDLLNGANDFFDQLLINLGNKEALVGGFFDHFSELPREQAALEYVSSISGLRQQPIP